MKNSLQRNNQPFWIYYLAFLAFFIPLAWIYNAHAEPITIDQTKIIESFIHFEEGKSLNGYVPLVKGANSGVTIGYGVDLGQMHLREFEKLDISHILKNKLKPYIGLKKERAIWFLNEFPLKITHEELMELSFVSKNKILQPLIKYYDEYSEKSFITLPPEAQTVIFSFAYQFGPNFKKKGEHHLLWYYFTSQNWAEASQLLKKFNSYTNRRTREAALLDKILYRL
jgi:hypothetical protein